MQLAHLLERAGQHENALAEYRKIRRIYPTSVQAAFQTGAVLEKLQRPAEAATAYRQSIALEPDFVPALNNLAWLLATSENSSLKAPDEALKLAMAAAEKTRFESAPILDTLATAQMAAGNRKAAMATLAKAIPLASAAGQTDFAAELSKKLRDYENSNP